MFSIVVETEERGCSS